MLTCTASSACARLIWHAPRARHSSPRVQALKDAPMNWAIQPPAYMRLKLGVAGLGATPNGCSKICGRVMFSRFCTSLRCRCRCGLWLRPVPPERPDLLVEPPHDHSGLQCRDVSLVISASSPMPTAADSYINRSIFRRLAPSSRPIRRALPARLATARRRRPRPGCRCGRTAPAR